MKRALTLFTGMALALSSVAATLNPIQLLNPSGSSAGQAIVSSGPGSAPAWGSIAPSGLSPQGANTVLGNGAASTATPTALAVPSCSAATNALLWTNGAGFSCNASINAATLNGATFAAPGAIGGTTAGSGAFTSLSASGTVSGAGFSTYLASPPAIGGTAPNAGAFTALTANATSLGGANVLILTNTTAGTGAQIRMVGDGATTPTKTVRALGGNFQIINDAYSAAILSLTDGGSLTTTGGINGTSVGMGTPAAGAFTSLSASSNAKVIAGNAGGQTVASASATVVTTWTASVNTGTAFNTSTGVFTAPAAGQYLVSATIGLSGPTWAAGNIVQVVINKNGSTYKIGTTTLQASGSGNLIVATVTSLVDLAASDTVSISAFHNGTGSATTSASLGATGNHLSIVRIP